eukprot:12592968-Heterocapsa_arctica.AAC.1
MRAEQSQFGNGLTASNSGGNPTIDRGGAGWRNALSCGAAQVRRIRSRRAGARDARMPDGCDLQQ